MRVRRSWFYTDIFWGTPGDELLDQDSGGHTGSDGSHPHQYNTGAFWGSPSVLQLTAWRSVLSGLLYQLAKSGCGSFLVSSNGVVV